MAKVNIGDKLSLFHELWTPKVIAEMNDYQFKLVKLQGEFVWHNHVDTDEVFIVVKGSMCIEMEHETVTLSEGENLPAKVEYARSYARLVYDRELHDQLLNEVLAAPVEQPGMTLFNVMAQEQAEALLESADDYF